MRSGTDISGPAGDISGIPVNPELAGNLVKWYGHNPNTGNETGVVSMNPILEASRKIVEAQKAINAMVDEFDSRGLAFSRKVIGLVFDGLQERTGVDPFFFSMHKQTASHIGRGRHGWEGDEQDYRGETHFLYATSIPTLATAFIEKPGFRNETDLQNLHRLLLENGYGEKDMPLAEILADDPKAMAFAAGFDDIKFLHYNEQIVHNAEQRYLENSEKICPGFGEDYKKGHFEAYRLGTGEYGWYPPKYRHPYLTFCLIFQPTDDDCFAEPEEKEPRLRFLVTTGKKACPDSSPGTTVKWRISEKLSPDATPEDVATQILDTFRIEKSVTKKEESASPGPSM